MPFHCFSLSLSLSQRLFQRSSLRHSAFAFYFRFSTFSSLYFHRFLCIVVRFSRYGFSMHLHPAAFRCFCVSLAQLPPPSPLFRSIPVIPVPSRPLRRHISAPLFHSFARLLLLLLSSLRRFALNVPLSLSLSLSPVCCFTVLPESLDFFSIAAPTRQRNAAFLRVCQKQRAGFKSNASLRLSASLMPSSWKLV